MANYEYATSVKLYDTDFQYLQGKGIIQDILRGFIEECIEENFTERYPKFTKLHVITLKLTHEQEKMLKEYVKTVYHGTISEFVRNCVHYKVQKKRNNEQLGVAVVEKIPFL